VLRRHIADLRAAFSHAAGPSAERAQQNQTARRKLRERIGKLMGGSAILWVGGATELEINARKARAERMANALRGALMEGVLPGGGVSLLACRPALREVLDRSLDPDERAAYRILIKAMEEPTRTILTNAGYDASEVMADIEHTGPGHGFDVRCGQIVNVAEAGIYDVASAQRAAVHTAIASAALALTVDVLIHHKTPASSMTTA
jgi:chaperonin GroEL